MCILVRLISQLYFVSLFHKFYRISRIQWRSQEWGGGSRGRCPPPQTGQRQKYCLISSSYRITITVFFLREAFCGLEYTENESWQATIGQTLQTGSQPVLSSLQRVQSARLNSTSSGFAPDPTGGTHDAPQTP